MLAELPIVCSLSATAARAPGAMRGVVRGNTVLVDAHHEGPRAASAIVLTGHRRSRPRQSHPHGSAAVVAGLMAYQFRT